MRQVIEPSASKAKSKLQEPIAIVGSACRFPGGASNPSKLWDLLRQPRDVLRKIPEDRFSPEAFYHPDGTHHGTSNVTESYLLEEDPRVFDAGFFSIKPVEAHATDPQHRILLETVYEALESAGLPMEGVAGSQAAVYVGQMWCDYNDHLQRDMDSLPTYAGVGTARSILSNRISHFFDWHGPSATIDTACSSSLVAVYNAVMTLRNGDSPMAVVAGANIILTPEPYIGESKLKMLSHDSRSCMWDEDAKGYARGDGVAALILKPLSAAVADGDHIESVIRECLVNQDGRTAEGITVPSSEAQAELIQRTYSKAGLDALSPLDRCQYFEAHGTGTGAGDPREARAIATAFFGKSHRSDNTADKLYVGSIKTVIGHTEGTAGIAGIMKASLAVQHGEIPPNLLFNKLSPAVAPFYNNLEIPVTPQRWPSLPPGVPRRASINSFGFGGTNAHVILESFDQSLQHSFELKENENSRHHLLSPFVFSASSEKSLKNLIQHYVSYLEENPTTNLSDLSYTLSRRSALSCRISFPAQSVEDLLDRLNEWLKKTRSSPDVSHSTRLSGSSGQARVLGVFTGQGAQWATMGKQLITNFPQVRSILTDMDRSLGALPHDHRPQWSILDELLADTTRSRVHLAAFSQPLCTAVQVVLVDLLRASGVDFSAVVGHSSGEIAAAYAAGFITASSAIIIAYYRGRATALAGQNKSQKGAMMAIGTSLEDAEELCVVDTLEGRISIAAVNSPSSITLSGDADAIEEARLILEDEGKFARILKVDKAYHSEHMLPCVDSYLRAMTECDVSPRRNTNQTCAWFSSVHAGTRMQPSDPDLTGKYWCDNMAKPVLFSNAATTAWEQHGPFDAVVEVGAHPALKGPFLQTLQELNPKASSLPYTGLLSRNQDDVSSFTQGVGALWQNLGHGSLDFAALDRRIAPNKASPRLLKTLPSYTWDHDRVYWHESRLSKAYRTRKSRPHALLGTLTSDGLETEMRWRNLLRVSELPWVKGHTLQGQVVFPAAGYIVTAMEAAMAAAGDRSPRLVAVNNVVISRALTLEDDVDVETLVSLSKIRHEDPDVMSAEFQYHALIRRDAPNLTLLATASVELTLEPAKDSDSGLMERLPLRSGRDQPNLLEVVTDDFYDFLEEVGYGYTGPFRALKSMQRKLDYGTGRLQIPNEDWNGSPVLIHPAFLDASFQAIFLAMGWPRDAGLVEVFVPTEFQSIKVDVANWKAMMSRPDLADEMVFDSRLRQLPESITGDVEVFSPPRNPDSADDVATLIQVENIKVVPFSPDSAASNRQLYSKTVYYPITVDGIEASGGRLPTDQELDMAWDLERVGIYFLRAIEEEFADPESRSNIAVHHQYFFDFSHDILSRVSQGSMPYAKKDWLNDTWSDVAPIFHRYPDSLDLQLMQKVGTNMAASIRGEANMVEILFKDDFMDRFYAGALGLDLTMDWLGRIALQLSRRYPHMKMLELGAGTGGATKSIFKHIGSQFSSYTFTDISAGFFSTAMNVFKSPKMIFKTLDAERDVVEQGFQEGYYDLVIASNVLHATAKLDDTLRNARRLLKPGGYLLIAEVTCADVVRVRFPFSALPGWFRGHDDGRPLTATIDTTEWHQRLSRTGFSGVDAVTPEFEPLAWPSLIILSQAVDDRINLLREPLYHQPLEVLTSDASSAEESQKLVLVGGQTMQSCSLIGQLSRILAPWFAGTSIVRVRSIRDLSKLESLGPNCCVINLSDLDTPVMSDLSDESFAGLKKLVERPKCLLWITSGCQEQSPEMNMSIGLGRVLIHEMPGLRLQFLDLDSPYSSQAPRVIAETFLRWKTLAEIEQDDDSSHALLWAREHELVLENDMLKVPRIAYDAAMNLRYTASRKLVTESTNSQMTPVHLRCSGTLWKFHKLATVGPSVGAGDWLKVTASSATPSYGGLYAVLASPTGDNTPHVALSTVNGSLLSPQDLAADLSVDADVENPNQFLSSLVCELQAASILGAVPHKSSVMLYEADEALAASVLLKASEKELRVTFASTSVSPGNLKKTENTSWVKIEPHSSLRMIRSQLPPKMDIIVNCVEARNTSLPATLLSALPQRCSKLALLDLVHQRPTNSFKPLDILTIALNRVSGRVMKGESTKAKSLQNLDLSEDLDIGLSVIIDWSSDGGSVVPAVVPPVSNYLSFKPDRTYVLFGLTSDLGQSLCDWMINHGARHLVMTSRSPNVGLNWLRNKEQAGVEIRIFANDITDEAALRGVVEDIRTSMPPIAGIANGAMVLRDKLLMDMPLDMMTQTLHTKVKGSIYLDSIFGENSEFNLDFFVFFSSIAAVTGNRAQSNYSAANMFMTALANNRRARGLPASVMHIGAIMGVGYMARNLTRAILDNLWSAGATWISEKDFHNCFAEAVLASKPDNGVNGDSEFIVGLRQLVHGKDSPDKVLVMEDPRFSHLVTKEISSEDDSSQDAGARKSTSVKHLLKSAKTPKSVERIVRQGFVAKLVATLQLDNHVPEAEILGSRADELGVDSLVSVDFRTWFSSEMSVEMPVLKLLGGSTVQELITFSLEKLPAALTPSLGDGNGDEPEEEEISQPTRDVSGSSKPMQGMETHGLPERPPKQQAAPVPLLEMPKVPEDIETIKPFMPTGSSSRSSPSLLDDAFSDSEEDGVVSLSSSAGSASPELVTPSKLQFSQVDREIPMSAGQSRFWFLKHFVTDKSAFNITFWAQLKGNIRVDAISKAVDTVAQAHEALRTSFTTGRDGTPTQCIRAKALLKLEHKFVRDESDARLLFDELKSHEYDIKAGDLMRFNLLTLSDQVHFLVIGYHHINMDGISLEVLLGDIEKVYFGHPLSPPIQYSEYCCKQSQDLHSNAFADEKRFWAKELTNPAPTVLPLLPFAKTTQRKPLDKYSHNQAQGQVDIAVTRAIKAACRRTKTSMFHFLLATYAVLLHRLLEVQDFCIGMADAGREMGTFAQSIGMYLNLLPLRFAMSSGQRFKEVLESSRRKAQAAVAHGRLPFDMILQEAGVERSDTYNPLFQAFLNYRLGVSQNRTFCGCQGQGEDWVSGTTSYDIMLDVIENPDSATLLRFDVQGSLYTKEEAQTLMDTFVTLLESFANNTDVLIDEPPLFNHGEAQRALTLGRGPEHISVWPETVLHRIDRIARQQPNSLAITNGFASSLTYCGLKRRVQAIAQALHQSVRGRREGLIGVFCEPSVDAVCALLGAMWAGFAYVPLDPTLPAERLAVLVKTSQPLLILTHDKTIDRVADLGPTAEYIAHLNVSHQQPASLSSIPISSKPQEPMAVHFTSGTTGTPKGVVLCHGTVVNVVEACADIYRTASNVVLQQTALNFDMALWQILVTLCSGGKLVIVPQEKRLDMSAISRLIRQEEVTLTIATPSEYSAWLMYGSEDLQHNRHWQIAVIGGEQYSSSVDSGLRNLQLPRLRLMNFYGPSEVSFVSHYMEVFPGTASTDEPVPVGFPLHNYAAYILDAAQRPVATGMTGEVYIAGAGVCKGYLDNLSLTEEKFVDDPFVRSDLARSHGWTRMYKTGDKGKINEDGTLSILGRIEGDAQLKIRGVRMELEEIERAILNNSDGLLDQVVVSPRGEGESKYLVAHALLSARGRHNTNIDEQLRDTLQNITNLPRVMRPATIVPVTNLPLTIHRKVDRRAAASLPVNTPQLQQASPVSQHERPLTIEQHEMLRLWSRVLGRCPAELTGPASAIDFFNLGGTSLQLVGVQAAIQAQFDVSVPVVELFKKSSLEAMTALVATEIESVSDDESDVDWESETALPDLSPVSENLLSYPTVSVRQPPRVVALTGATGFVGQAVLRSLLATPSIEKIHCLAVRDSTRLGEMCSDRKVVVHQGDLRDASLSLDDSTKETLARTVDLIIHNGADVSFLKPYAALRAPNVSSTKFLATEIAAPRRIPITYISSAVVGRLAPELDAFAPVPMSHRPPPPGYRDAYGASKWASEAVLENANRDLGIPVTVRRLSSVTGAGIPDSDIMGNLVAYSEKLAAVPVTQKWKGVLDFVSVDRVAQAVVADAMRRSRADEVRYRHDCSDEVVSLDADGICSFISQRLHGKPVKVLPMTEWIGKAKNVGMSDLVCTFLEQAEKESRIVTFQKLLK
ncbi:Polyketide synthase-nonribosomal peptide synthetase [Colletotrichum fructicola]|nr:Polyketide synthase-nonribosomal peptide synthetase [Colletotrichum fructicola]